MNYKTSIILLSLLALAFRPHEVFGGDPWLMAFPEIAYDDNRICFSNDDWTAYYHLESKSMYTIPRDSINIPPRRIPTNTVIYNNDIYSYHGGGIERVRTPEQPAVYNLPELTDRVAQPFVSKWKNPPKSLQDVHETIGPIALNRNTLWFGLTAEDSKGQVSGGLGWFSVKSKRFGRIYSPALVSNVPKWIEVVRDTVVIMYESQVDFTEQVYFYSLKSAKLWDLDYQQAGIPGSDILGIDKWKNFILLATDEAVAVWAPGYLPNVWTTKAYAARTPIRLKLLRFENGKPDYKTMEDFLPMLPNRPSEVMAQVGDLVELVAHAGVEAYVSKQEWDRNSSRWQGFDWGCGDNLCFARVRVPTQGRYIEGDILNTPLTFIADQGDQVKVGFTAGWIPIHELSPALLPYP